MKDFYYNATKDLPPERLARVDATAKRILQRRQFEYTVYVIVPKALGALPPACYRGRAYSRWLHRDYRNIHKARTCSLK